ncbi:MAG TPA: nucleotide exchange factor GrpE [Candidatus Limnocylindrales bacterium]|nr:nucleotide exchange factor GrpE [Candidatus Limnocylindrales bacterium]
MRRTEPRPTRHTNGGDEPAQPALARDAVSGAELDALRERLAAAEQEAGDLRATLQRTAADFQNYKRRTEQDREANLGLANEALLRKLLAVVDDFDRALEAMPGELKDLGWIEGIWLVERKLRALLESEGVTPIDAVGRPFDPREHEAVVHQETTDAADDTVISELQRGYRIRDRVLRPALVTVAKNPGRERSAERSTTDDDMDAGRQAGRGGE